MNARLERDIETARKLWHRWKRAALLSWLVLGLVAALGLAYALRAADVATDLEARQLACLDSLAVIEGRLAQREDAIVRLGELLSARDVTIQELLIEQEWANAAFERDRQVWADSLAVLSGRPPELRTDTLWLRAIHTVYVDRPVTGPTIVEYVDVPVVERRPDWLLTAAAAVVSSAVTFWWWEVR